MKIIYIYIFKFWRVGTQCGDHTGLIELERLDVGRPDSAIVLVWDDKNLTQSNKSKKEHFSEMRQIQELKYLTSICW